MSLRLLGQAFSNVKLEERNILWVYVQISFDFTIQIYVSCVDSLIFVSQQTTASQNASKYFGWVNVFSVRPLYPENFTEKLYVES